MVASEELRKLIGRNSSNSSIPRNQDLLKKPSAKNKDKAKKKREPKYNHPSSTRNGFGQPDTIENITLEQCPACGGGVRLVEGATQQVFQILTAARTADRDYYAQKLSQQDLYQQRCELEATLQAVLDIPPSGGWSALAQRLRMRFQKYWSEWFTFLTYPEVKPDNDAERALRPVIVHRKVSEGARSDWGTQLVAQMFSFLETVRLMDGNAASHLFELLTQANRSPPVLQST